MNASAHTGNFKFSILSFGLKTTPNHPETSSQSCNSKFKIQNREFSLFTSLNPEPQRLTLTKRQA
jgi:hypothetical protein